MAEFSFEACRGRHRWGFFRPVSSGRWAHYIQRVCRVCGITQRRKPRILNNESSDMPITNVPKGED